MYKSADGQWIAHSLDDFKGWKVLSMESVQLDLYRVQVVRANTDIWAEKREVYLITGSRDRAGNSGDN